MDSLTTRAGPTAVQVAPLVSTTKQWMFGSAGSGQVLAKQTFTARTDRNYWLKNRMVRKFLQYEKQSFGINLGWTDDADKLLRTCEGLREDIVKELDDLATVCQQTIRWIAWGDTLLAEQEKLRAAFTRHVEVMGELLEQLKADRGDEWWKGDGPPPWQP